MTSAGTDVRPDQRQQEFIAAIHAIVNADRLLTEQELLTTTACELLVDGALGTDELVRQINEIWAGASIPEAPIVSALQTAVEAGLMLWTPTGSGIMWSLTPAGRVGAGGARDWTENAYARTVRQLQDLAATDFRPVGDIEARLWVDLLAQALSDGIREAYAAFVGDVMLLIDGSLIPRGFDRDRALGALQAANLDEGTTRFLETTVLGALDRTDPFGNDLVNHIATGCVLLAFLAGCDHAKVRSQLQNLTDEEFLLDTPVLVQLTGADEDSQPIVKAIQATLAAGGRVVVAEHTAEEFIELVEAIGADQIPALVRALSDGLNARAYCTTVSLPALETWVAALDEGRYKNWQEFDREAHRIRQRLEDLGVTVRPHGNYVPETVAACTEALRGELAQRNGGRKEAAIGRDANTMAMVVRHRAKHRDSGRLWPGCWMVTTDRYIGPAYRKVSVDDVTPAVLTITQWAVLIMSCRQTATVRELASVAAPLVRYQAALAIAARYPADVALEIAKILAPADGPASTDLRLAQLNPPEAMDALLDPNTGLPAGMTRLGLAGDLLARRQLRMDAVRAILTKRAEEDRLLAEVRASRAEQAAEREKFARETVERQLRESAHDVGDLADQLAEARRQIADEHRLGRRKAWYAVMLFSCGCVLLVSLIFALHVLAGATAVTTLVVAKLGAEWIKDPERSARGFILAVLTESIGLIQIFVHWLYPSRRVLDRSVARHVFRC